MLNIALVGAGRIAQIHAANIAAHAAGRLLYVIDPQIQLAERLAQSYGAHATSDLDATLGDPAVKAVVIASPTPTHVNVIEKSARAGKAIFCEKPIDLNLQRVGEVLRALEFSPVPFFVGFNRRFDPSFANLQQRLRAGEIGSLEMLVITSRDPTPPPASYLPASGGLFCDMTIHDFDMARWLCGEEFEEMFASASCLVDPSIGAIGDIDTAMLVLKTKSGVLCHINNSRRAVYGYDQRIEAFGSQGMLQAGNVASVTTSKWDIHGVSNCKPLPFFLERYAAAYTREMDHFITSVLRGDTLSSKAQDGYAALLLAEAAQHSLHQGRAVKIKG